MTNKKQNSFTPQYLTFFSFYRVEKLVEDRIDSLKSAIHLLKRSNHFFHIYLITLFTKESELETVAIKTF